MKNVIRKIWNIFLELLFPSNLNCMFCKVDVPDAIEKPYCDECEISAPFNRGNRCKFCDMAIPDENEVCDFCQRRHKAFDKAVAAMRYETVARNLILRLKYDNAKFLAPKMAKLMFDRLCDENFNFDIILPVPLSEKSLKKRKYNQSELLAESLSQLCNVEQDCQAFAKVKETKHQKELGFSDRQHNLRNAFKVVDKKVIFGKDVLLVDDVVTTGATASECAKVLKKYAKHVYVVSFARNPLLPIENT